MSQFVHVSSLLPFLMGGPGCGKGTLAASLSSFPGLVVLTVSDLLRQMAENKPELKSRIIPVMKAGGLVKSDLVSEVVAAGVMQAFEVGAKIVVLDGFPRTYAQACTIAELRQSIPRSTGFVSLELQLAPEEALGRLKKRYEEAITAGRKPRADDADPQKRTERVQRYESRQPGIRQVIAGLNGVVNDRWLVDATPPEAEVLLSVLDRLEQTGLEIPDHLLRKVI